MSGFETLSANSQNIKQFELKQKAKNILLVLAIGVPVFLGMLAYLIYRNTTSQHSASPDQQVSQNENIGIDDQGTIPTDITDPSLSNPGITQTTPQDATSPSSPAVVQPSPQSSAGIPDGVVAAINSIEANGINGNPYVSSSLDTSNIPSGTKIIFERNSWTSYGPELGSVNISASVMGFTKNGSVTFSLTNGTWQATGYSIN